MKRKFIFLAIICLLLLPVTSLQAKESQTVEVTGLAPVSNDDLVTAKEKAVNKGLRRAVEQVVGTYISSTTRTKNAQLIEDEILRSSQGYVENYTILSKRVERGVYKVALRVKVGVGDLTNDLQALELKIKRHGNPRIMILIEQEKDHYYLNLSPTIVENQMMDQFIAAGYQVIDRYRIKKVIEQDQKQAIVQGNHELAAKLATKLKADLVIVGDARVSYIDLNNVYDGDVIGTLESYQAQINVKVINSSTAQVVAVASAADKGIGSNREGAAQKALEKTANRLTEELITKTSRQIIQEEKTVGLKITGVESITQLNELQDQLPTVTGVKAVHFREYNEGLAVFDLDVYSSTEILNLASELETEVNFQFRVSNMSDAQLTLELE